jgi:hypothetical protein
MSRSRSLSLDEQEQSHYNPHVPYCTNMPFADPLSNDGQNASCAYGKLRN